MEFLSYLSTLPNRQLAEAASGAYRAIFEHDGGTGRPVMNVYYRGFDSRHKLFGKYGGTWVTPDLEYAVMYANTNGDGTVARISVCDSDERITTADDLMEILGIEPDMAIDMGTWPEWIEKLREAGFNMVYNYLDDSENGYCILDPGIIRDIHVMTDEEIREELADRGL